MPVSKYGPWALIVGGSEGVGAEFGRKLASDGINLILVARKPEPLERLAGEIRAASGVAVRALSLDMAADGAVEKLLSSTADLDIGLLICNAGAGVTPGQFIEKDIAAADKTVRLNVIGPTILARHFGQLMASRGRGGLLFVGSGAGEVGTACLAVYSAAKSYMRTLAEALWYELKPRGVDVLILVLGVTRTPQLGRVLGYPIDDASVPGSDPGEMALAGLAHLPEGPVYYAAETAALAEELNGLTRQQAVQRIGDEAAAIMRAGANHSKADGA